MTNPKPDFSSLAGHLDVVTPELLSTSGHPQVVVRCPRCNDLHRHCGLGLRRSPCGALYFVSSDPEKTLAAVA